MFIKTFLLLFTSLILFGNTVYAEDKVLKKDSIKTLVEQVKKAPPAERRVLMNALKVKLRSMHSEMRTKIMLDLRHSFNQQNTKSNTKKMNTQMSHTNMMRNEAKSMKSYMKVDKMPAGTNPMNPGSNPMPRGGM